MPQRWIKLADNFPPTLNKVTDGIYLKPNESPAAYGIDPDKPSYLASGTCPTGTTAIAKTYTISDVEYNWWYNRLWRISTTQVIYGAPEYTEAYFAQGLGHIDFLEDSENIIKLVPFANGAMAALKTTGGYIISNASSQDGNFSVSDIMQELKLDVASHAVELNGLLYVCNASGLFVAAGNGEVTEVTMPVRTTIAPFASQALTCDYLKGYVIGGSNQFCYDTINKKLFDFSSDGFLYTSPTLKMRAKGYEGNPFTVDAVAFEVYFSGITEGEAVIQTKVGERDWTSEQEINFTGEDEFLDRVKVHLEEPGNGRTFAMRINSITSGLYIKTIYVSSEDYVMEGLSE